ncbi:hypothetical protein [Emcibacter nanhaiensis]|uniref:Lipoprotein n=1 Tax=Emcibacter nanhaiensis TaxID=1505037 RepID=A0A501PQ01_9PROT|nr:hypothetical protein [Emcibacter nanhaiensis]TPD61781.1 hypothetical protein FIV46_06115 [Emcibacter nanhaiensis]
MMQRILLILFIISLAACTREAGEEMARNICDSAGNCSYRCPDGTLTSAGFPRCPINDRDLLPPGNEDVGPPRK